MPEISDPAARARAGAGAAIGTLARYLIQVVPPARRRLRAIGARAATIPDPVLRDHALSTLAEEHLNAEAAAVFALLTPRAQRAQTIELTVTFQAIYDYLDTVSEQPSADPLANGLRLHAALTDAVSPVGTPLADHYSLHDRRDDGGYLAGLVEDCRRALHALPGADPVAAALLQETRRCGEAQSHTHAAMLSGDTGRLEDWARAQDQPLAWWEVASGGISSLGVHALLATAGRPDATAAVAASVAAAYSPWICALSTLLDSLVDAEADARSGNWSYVAAYDSSDAAAAGLERIARASASVSAGLPDGDRHLVIVAGLAGFYLSAPGASLPSARPARDGVVAALQPAVRPTLLALGARRRLARAGR